MSTPNSRDGSAAIMGETDSGSTDAGRWRFHNDDGEEWVVDPQGLHYHIQHLPPLLNALEAELTALRGLNVSLKSQLEGFREGVRIGMTYTRQELASLRAEKEQAEKKASLAERYRHAQTLTLAGEIDADYDALNQPGGQQ